MNRTTLRFLWRDHTAARLFRTGVCLHSHTMHSRESLGFIPRYARRIPPLDWELRRQARKYREKYNREVDYNRAFWTPPLPAANALELERSAIERELGVAAFVSITDHDNVEAAALLGGTVPTSMEWTIPYGPSYFHIGIHNLPAGLAGELNACTRAPSDQLRNELLAAVAEQRDSVVVLNHPLWDQSGIGPERHQALLAQLLESSGAFIHALELNGLRPWEENQRVVDLAESRDRTLVSGGDRHGCQPASVVNLTDSSSFSEFAAEVRAGWSEILFLPHYREPVRYRLAKSVFDIMKDYPELPGRERWMDRVLCHRYTGATCSLAELYGGKGPAVTRWFHRLVSLAGCRTLRCIAHWYLAGSGREHECEPRRRVRSAGAPQEV